MVIRDDDILGGIDGADDQPGFIIGAIRGSKAPVHHLMNVLGQGEQRSPSDGRPVGRCMQIVGAGSQALDRRASPSRRESLAARKSQEVDKVDNQDPTVIDVPNRNSMDLPIGVAHR